MSVQFKIFHHTLHDCSVKGAWLKYWVLLILLPTRTCLVISFSNSSTISGRLSHFRPGRRCKSQEPALISIRSISTWPLTPGWSTSKHTQCRKTTFRIDVNIGQSYSGQGGNLWLQVLICHYKVNQNQLTSHVGVYCMINRPVYQLVPPLVW